MPKRCTKGVQICFGSWDEEPTFWGAWFIPRELLTNVDPGSMSPLPIIGFIIGILIKEGGS